MNDIQMTVLAKVVGEKEAKAARKGVAPGQHPVDFTVRVHGVMKVGEDYERAATTSIPWLEVTTLYREVFRGAIDELIAKIDNGAGVTRADLTGMATAGVLTTGVLVDCIRKALDEGSSAVGTIKDKVQEVEKGVEKLKKDIVAKTPPQQVPGKVSLDVEVDEVDLGEGVPVRQVAEEIEVGVNTTATYVAEIDVVEIHNA